MKKLISALMAGVFPFSFSAWGQDKDTIPLMRNKAPGATEKSTVPTLKRAPKTKPAHSRSRLLTWLRWKLSVARESMWSP